MKTLMINVSMNLEFSASHFSGFVLGLILVTDEPQSCRPRASFGGRQWLFAWCRIHFYTIVQKARGREHDLFFHDTINRKWEGASAARGVSVEVATEVRTFP